MNIDELQAQAQQDLQEIGDTFMPFGKYGPQHYPPSGLPLYELPVEYLGWFAGKGGFPKGRLGQLLQMVYQMKVDGSDLIFDRFRNARGGRIPLRKSAPRNYQFGRGD